MNGFAPLPILMAQSWARFLQLSTCGQDRVESPTPVRGGRGERRRDQRQANRFQRIGVSHRVNKATGSFIVSRLLDTFGKDLRGVSALQPARRVSDEQVVRPRNALTWPALAFYSSRRRPLMATRKLDKNEWKTFFDRVSKMLEGKQAEIE